MSELFRRIGVATFFVFSATASIALAQSTLPKLDWLVDWRDGIPYSGVGPANATESPNLLRFWVGHGLSLAQIRIDSRERQLFEEEDQPYEHEIHGVLFDESGSSQAAHRILVLTSAQAKTTPKSPARLYLLSATTPSAPDELYRVDLVDSSASGWFYDVTDICFLPGTTIVAAVGTATKEGQDAELLVMLFDRQQVSGQEQLVKLAEVRQPKFALDALCGSTLTRYFKGVREALVHKVGADFLLFAVGPVDPVGRSIEGVAAARLDPTATLEADRVQWYTATSHVFDAPYWVTCESPGGPSSSEWHERSANTLAAVADGGSPERHWLYVGGGADVELQEFEITDFHQNGFPAPTDMGLQEDEPIYWIEAHHDTTTGVDILLVAGLTHIHAIKRVDPMWPGDYGTTAHKFGVTVDGHVMREIHGGGPKDMLWTVSADTNSPWSIFDVTERPLVPGVLPPDLEQSFYLPGGTDGAVAIPELGAAWVGTFGGIVQYELTGLHPWTGSVAATPVPSSYRPATVSGNHIVEQVELAHFGDDDYWLVTPNGLGGALWWKIDTSTKVATPMSPVLTPPWPAWPTTEPVKPYGQRATFAYSEALETHFLLLDLALRDKPHARLGRFIPDPETPSVLGAGEWDYVELLDGEDGVVQGWITDVATSPDGRWAFVGMKNGFAVVELNDAQGEKVFNVVDVIKTSSATIPALDPFGTGRDYTQVEGIASYRDCLIVNATHADPSNQQPPAAIAVFAFDYESGAVGEVIAVHEGDIPGQQPSGALAGVKLWGGGPVRVYEVEPGVARVYTGSNEYGTVVEFELLTDQAIADFNPLAYWHNGSHFTQTADVRPYDVGDPSGLPVVLVSRYRQTIGVVAASGLLPGPE